MIFSLLVCCAGGTKSEENSGDRYGLLEVGLAAGIFDNSFVDDVISPVVYTASSPIYEALYRFVDEEARGAVSLKYVSYTAAMRDGFPGDDFELLDSDGDPYSFPRSMHEMKGSRFEMYLDISKRVAAFHDGKTAFYLGGEMKIFFESMKSYDYWSSTMGWEKQKSELSGFSIIMTGKLERRIRRLDRLAIDLDFTLASLVERLPYYAPLSRMEDLDEDSNISPNTYGMLFYDYLDWSVQFSYMFWIWESLGLEASYRFRHQHVTEPRPLRYVSNTLSLGVIFAIKDEK